jgi:tripartite-type tricarboxylate transporter receptor subunit TctC
MGAKHQEPFVRVPNRPFSAVVMVGAVNLAVLVFAASATAQNFPIRPMRLVIGFAAGGGTDVAARTVAAALSERLGQQVVVENRGGAGGALASELVAHAVPDGYTLLGCGIAHTLAPLLRENLPFDTAKDFAPITATAMFANVMVVGTARPWRTVGELIAQAKAEPGKLTYGSSGVGSTLHLSMELFKSMAGVDIVHVPYKGGSPALADVIAGHIDMTFDNIPGELGAIKGGQVRALAVSSRARNAQLPDVPTLAEAGVPGFELVGWYGLCAPAGVPEPILDKLHAAAVAVLETPSYRRSAAEQGIDPAPMTRAQYAAFLEAQAAKWAKVVRDAGVRPE